jgi:endoglycosylceramidase
MVYGEPYTLFNFGQAPTHIARPGNDPESGMSYHLYPADASGELPVQQYAEEWSDCTGALMNTEFGATDDTTTIDRQVNLFDGSLVSWMWWAYSERMIVDLSKPPTDDNLNLPVVETLVRPHPRTIAGTPTSLDFDRTDRVMRFSYTTARVDGTGSFPSGAGGTTEIEVAPRTYPEGYQVAVTGGTVTSAPDAARLTVVADGSGSPVTVKVWPAGQATPADTVTTAPVVAPATCSNDATTPVTTPAAEAVVTRTAFTG